MKKVLEEQLRQLKKQLGNDIAVKIIIKKNKFKIVGVVAKDEDGDEYEVPINKTSKDELNKIRNYIG